MKTPMRGGESDSDWRRQSRQLRSFTAAAQRVVAAFDAVVRRDLLGVRRVRRLIFRNAAVEAGEVEGTGGCTGSSTGRKPPRGTMRILVAALARRATILQGCCFAVRLVCG
jgi:hypothetical protein